MAKDGGFGVCGFEAMQLFQQGLFLLRCACVGRSSELVQPTFVANTQGVLIVAYGMSTDKLFVACLIGLAVAGDVVVVTCESEAFRVTADECCHGKTTVAARGATVNYNQIDMTHNG